MCDQLIGAIDRQGVLNQVIRADRQVVEMAQKHLHAQRSSRYLDHGADFDGTKGKTPRIKLLTRFVQQSQRLLDFTGMGQHRD
jgi:hypothetical protein